MISLSRHPDGTSVEIDPLTIVRLGKVGDGEGGVDPSRVVTTDGEVVVAESVRTISARIGDVIPLSDYIDRDTGRAAAFDLRRVAALTKPMEDSGDGDPTLVHLATGEAFLVGESIRTLSARLSLDAGFETLDVDVEGTERPAAVVPMHVEAVLRLSGTGEEPPGAGCLVRLAGGTSLACMDDPDRLRLLVADARAAGPSGDPVPPVP